MNADASAQTRLLTRPDDLDLMPTWSPDGSRILFPSGDQLFLVNPDGTGLTKLTATDRIADANNAVAWK
ncbi:MAG: TolB family protein [Gemmatimonadales bacterium]